MRKFWLTLAMLALLTCLFAVSVSAATVVDSGECGDNVTWTLYDNGELVIEGTGEMWEYTNNRSSHPWYIESHPINHLTINTDVTSIGTGVFTFYEALTNISVNTDNQHYASIDGVLFNKTKTALIQYPTGKDGSYTIPSSVTSIREAAFMNCKNLPSVTIPHGVTSIGKWAFAGCDKLTSVTIPTSVTSIGCGPFSGDSLTNISVNTSNKYYVSINGVLFNKDKTELLQYPTGKDGSYTIPSSVTSIGEEAFMGCTKLTSVVISSGVTSIGRWSFAACDKLTTIIIPGSVTSIGSFAFHGCPNLASATILSNTVTFGQFQYVATNFTIYAYAGSMAETCAKNYDHNFVALTTPPPHTHTPGAAATCTTAQTCTFCGTVLAKATGHKPGAAATCTTAQTCTSCGTVLAKATGHKPGAVATCTTAQACISCGTVLAKATGHTPGAAATCTTAQTCTSCGEILMQPTEHDYTYGVLVEEEHPHRVFNICSCGAESETNETHELPSCSICSPTDPTSPDVVDDPGASERGAQIRHALWISFAVVFCVVITVYELIHIRNKKQKDEIEE